MNNIENDSTDKILGMNRIMFFIIVALLCVLSLSIGIYAQVFYRYSDTDPLMLGIGVGKTQNKAELVALKNSFDTIFTNDLEGNTKVKKIKLKNDKNPIVYTYQKVVQKDEEKYNIVAYLPKVNIDSIYAEKINSQINSTYADRIEEILTKTDKYIDYGVSYKAYLNGDLLSLIIKETVYEGSENQTEKIQTYNYNLNNNTEVSIMDIVKAKKYNQKQIQNDIYREIDEINEKAKQLKSQYSEVKIRDKNNNMYKLENTENFAVNPGGYVYIIYSYGNTENTNTKDILVFE